MDKIHAGQSLCLICQRQPIALLNIAIKIFITTNRFAPKHQSDQSQLPPATGFSPLRQIVRHRGEKKEKRGGKGGKEGERKGKKERNEKTKQGCWYF